jgi:hypothetical protein
MPRDALQKRFDLLLDRSIITSHLVDCAHVRGSWISISRDTPPSTIDQKQRLFASCELIGPPGSVIWKWLCYLDHPAGEAVRTKLLDLDRAHGAARSPDSR